MIGGNRIRLACTVAALVIASILAGGAAAAPPQEPPGLAAALTVQERHADRLLELPGVEGVGVGITPGGGPVIRVYLAWPDVDNLPTSLEGFEVSRVVTGMIVARGDTLARYRPAPIGVSTGHPAITAGTIGARVVDASGTVYALSNNHVYANQNDAVIGDNVLQPGAYDGGTNPADAIGTLYAFEPLRFDGSNNTMDAAIARSSAANLGVSTLGDGYGTPSTTPVAAFVGQLVKKYGRTTSMTQGQVSEINVTVDVCYEALSIFCLKSARFVNQIGVTPGSFSAGGDSGSLIVTQSGNNPVALLFAGSSSRTLASPIAPVLARFAVTIDDGSGTGGGNQAPAVDAGPSQTITLPVSASLDGTVTDDDLPDPPGAVTTEWAKQSGPGTVSFANAAAVDTTASFAAAGTYVLVLTADDGAAQTSDTTTITVNPEPGGGGGGGTASLYLALDSSATVGGVSVANEDVLAFDGASFATVFDGSDVGVGAFRIDAFAWLDADTLLLSFDSAGTVPGVSGTVDDSDLVRFDASSLGGTTAGSFQLYFDGSDVGLTSSSEDVDAIEVDEDGTILFSTTGSASALGVSAQDEDMISFLPLSLGSTTSGSMILYFDGSDVGLSDSSEDVDAVAFDPSGIFHLSTVGAFSVPGPSGQDEDVFTFTPTLLGPTTAGSFSSTPSFDGSSFGLDANDVTAIDLP